MADTSRGRGGKAPRGPGRGRRDGAGEPSGARARGRVEELSVVVDRREGVRVHKVSRVEHASHRVVGVVYRVEFEGRAPIDFDRLGAARDRAKEPPPEPPAPQPLDKIGCRAQCHKMLGRKAPMRRSMLCLPWGGGILSTGSPGPETSDGETARTATEDPGPQEQEAEKAGPRIPGEP